MDKDFDVSEVDLLCRENAEDLMFTDSEDDNIFDETEVSSYWQSQDYNQESFFSRNGYESFLGFIVHNEESLKEMIEREKELAHSSDYLQRLKSGELNMSFRKEGIDWICKATAHHNFGPLCFCLSLNYFDRYLSLHELIRDEAWTGQLLAVASLSLAAKMEESKVPKFVELQVGEPKFVFTGTNVQKMELLILSALKWRMLAVTPCTFIEYFLSKTIDDQLFSKSSITRSVRVIQNMIRVIDFLEFKPSEIAAAVAISVAREIQAVDIDKAMNCFIHVEKEKVMECVKMMEDLCLISRSTNGDVVSASVSQTPNGVLDLSLKSDE